MVLPSGEQYEIAAAGYVAVVTESGAALRILTHHGRDLVDGFAEDEMSAGGRGQLLMPWPNRIRDGRYSFGGRELQLGLTDPTRDNASHGLARWAAWTLEEHTGTSVSLVHRVMAQTGYPWTLDLHVLYDLSADGLVVTQTATNLVARAGAVRQRCASLPRRRGRHRATSSCACRRAPGWSSTSGCCRPAPSRSPAAYDFTTPRRIGDSVLDDGFGDLGHEDGRATVTLRDPAPGAASRCGSTSTTAGCSSSHRRRRAAGRRSRSSR